MAPVITIIRHGQGSHNVQNDYSIIDPTLTNLGKDQCRFVRNQFPHHNKVSHILVSPLFRTIETAYHAFKPAVDRGIRITAMPQVTENNADGCNRGHAPNEIIKWARQTFGSDVLDEPSFQSLPPYWYEKSAGLYEDSDSKLRLRALVARHILQKVASTAGDDAQIVVVSHQDFLTYLVNGPGWRNAEWRSYTIGTDYDATLTQINQ